MVTPISEQKTYSPWKAEAPTLSNLDDRMPRTGFRRFRDHSGGKSAHPDQELALQRVSFAICLRIWIRPRTERLRCNARRNWGLMPALMQVQSHPDNFNSDVFEAVPPGGCS